MSHARWCVFALVTTGAISLSNCSMQHEFSGYACPALSEGFDNVFQPMPGATNVPTAPGQLELAETLPVNVTVSLEASDSASPISLGELPTPAPGATASTAPPPVIFLNYPQLQSATTYTVVYTAAATTQPCPLGYGSDGVFTTQ
jgi:hypothetical protein